MADNIGAPQEKHNDQYPSRSLDQPAAGPAETPLACEAASGPAASTSNEPAPHRRERPKHWLVPAVAAAVLVLVSAVTVVLVMDHRADVAAEHRREAAERKLAAEEKAAEEARQAKAEAAAAELAAAEAQYNSCLDQLNPLLDSLQKVDARLDVGLSQSELSDMVGRSSIAYSRIDIDELGTGTCLRVGVQLEDAFNAYAGTVSRWNDCIFDYGCDTDALTPSLQTKWAAAARAIDKAADLLDSLDPHSSSYDAATASEIA